MNLVYLVSGALLLLEPPPVELEIQVDEEVLSFFDMMSQSIQRKVDNDLATTEPPLEPSQPVHIDVSITMSTAPGSLFLGEVSTPDILDIEPQSISCECTIPEFTQAVADSVISMARQSIEHNEMQAAQLVEATTPPMLDKPTSQPPTNPGNINHGNPRAMLGSGIALTVVGVAASIGGGVLWARDHEQETEWTFNGDMGVIASNPGGINQKQVGIGLVVGGAAVAGAGVALIVIGAKRHKASQRSKFSLIPTPWSIELSGRF